MGGNGWWNWSPSQAALLGSCMIGRLHSPVNVQSPRNTLHKASSQTEEVSSSLAATVISTKPCPPLIPMRDLKGSMELAITEVRRSPITSCQQAAELEKAVYSQAPDRP